MWMDRLEVYLSIYDCPQSFSHDTTNTRCWWRYVMWHIAKCALLWFTKIPSGICRLLREGIWRFFVVCFWLGDGWGWWGWEGGQRSAEFLRMLYLRLLREIHNQSPSALRPSPPSAIEIGHKTIMFYDCFYSPPAAAAAASVYTKAKLSSSSSRVGPRIPP